MNFEQLYSITLVNDKNTDYVSIKYNDCIFILNLLNIELGTNSKEGSNHRGTCHSSYPSVSDCTGINEG